MDGHSSTAVLEDIAHFPRFDVARVRHVRSRCRPKTDPTLASGLARMPQPQQGKNTAKIVASPAYNNQKRHGRRIYYHPHTFSALGCPRCARPHDRLLLQDAPFEHLESPGHGGGPSFRDVSPGPAMKTRKNRQQTLFCIRVAI